MTRSSREIHQIILQEKSINASYSTAKHLKPMLDKFIEAIQSDLKSEYGQEIKDEIISGIENIWRFHRYPADENKFIAEINDRSYLIGFAFYSKIDPRNEIPIILIKCPLCGRITRIPVNGDTMLQFAYSDPSYLRFVFWKWHGVCEKSPVPIGEKQWLTGFENDIASHHHEEGTSDQEEPLITQLRNILIAIINDEGRKDQHDV